MQFTHKQLSFVSLPFLALRAATAVLIGGIVIAIAAYPPAATAADKNCAQLKSAEERLACYDAQAPHSEADDSSDFAEIKKVVEENLIDPESVRIGRFTLVSAMFACLDVNAKNRFGGYVGFKTAMIAKESQHGAWAFGGFIDDGLPDSARKYIDVHDQCVVMGAEWKGVN